MTTRALTTDEIEWVCEKLSYIPTRNVRGLGNGTAAILFDQWTPNSVCVHSYIPEPRYLTKGFLREIFRYPFSNVDWILGITPGDNKKALEFNQRIGFHRVYVLPSGFDKGIDTVMQAMHHTGCKYYRRSE